VVWLTTEYPWAENPVGGIFHRTAARSLAAAGVRVQVISPTPIAPWPLSLLRNRWRRYARAPRIQVDAGVDVVRPRYPAFPGDPAWAMSDAMIARVSAPVLGNLPSAGLIHAHYPAPMGMAAWRLARSTGLPYVVTLHGSDNVWRDAHPTRLAAYRRSLRDAARVIAVSRSMVDEGRAVAGIEASVVPIGVDLARFAGEGITRAQARAALGIADDRIVVLLVATLVPAKGIRPFVDAVVELGRPFLAVLVGEGPEQGYRTSDTAARGLVEYRGVQPNEAIPTYLGAADTLILPSDTEGLPTVLVEAGAAGVPVIASQVGGIPDLLADDRGLLLPEVSQRAISEALRMTQGDPSATRARAGRFRDHVFAEYDAAANGRRLADIYRRVVEHSADRRQTE
jgi:teichuronic acid biosynthesis glycosyltransferase TuaC